MGYGTLHILIFPLRVAAAFLLWAGFLYVAYALARFLAPGKGAPTRPAAAILSGLWVATAIFHLLMAWHQFLLSRALMVVGVAALCARLAGYAPADFRRHLGRDMKWFCRTMQFTRGSRLRAVVYACILLIAIACLRTLLIPPIAWDAITYHAAKAGIWVQQGALELFASPGGWGEYYRSMFGGGESLTAWAMLPFHGDLVAPFNDALLWLALGLMMYALARQLGARARFAWPAAIFAMSIPAARLAVGALYVEIVLDLALLGALLFGARFARRRRWRDLLLSALGFGVAAGVKILAWPAIAAAMLILLALVWRAQARSSLFGWYLVGLLAVAVMVIPWIAFDVEETGRILGDMPIRIGRIDLGAASPTVSYFSHHPELRPYRWATEFAALREMFLSPVNPSVHSSVLSLVCVAVGLFAGVREFRRGRRAAVLLLFAVAGGTLAFFYHPSFTPSRLIWANTSSRFLLSLLFPMIALSATACRARGSALSLYGLFLWLGALGHLAATLFHGWAWCEFKGFASLSIPMVVVAGIAAFLPQVRSAASRHPLIASFLVVFLVLTTVRIFRTHSHRYKVAMEGIVMHDMPRSWVDAARALDTPGRPKRIAVTAGRTRYADNWFLYFFLGRDLQNTLLYVPVSRDGSILDLPAGEYEDPRIDAELWYRRLESNRVNAVMCFWPLPLEIHWLEQRREVYERIAGYHDVWGAYWVRPRPGTTFWLDDE